MAKFDRNQEQEHIGYCSIGCRDGDDNVRQVDELEVARGDEERVDQIAPANVFHGVKIRRQRQGQASSVRELPPPITLLGQMGDDPRCQMPLVFRRSYENHRLVIRMQRVRGHEFLRAHRSDGRLRLNLVASTSDPLHDSFDETGVAGAAPRPALAVPEIGGDGAAHERFGIDIGDEKAGGLGDQVTADVWAGMEPGKNVMGLAAGACSITSSILHLHMPTMRPVHS